MTDRPKAPKHVSAAMRDWWDSVNADWQLDHHHHYFSDLAAVGLECRGQEVPPHLAQDPWLRLGAAFMATRNPETGREGGPWALEKFGAPPGHVEP